MASPPTSSSSSDVKSTAVVQYSSVQFPVQFSTIRLNTDLNHPPSDRHGSRYHMYPNQHMPTTGADFSQFLSLNMANTYKDLVGQVDVISSSKNIKDLLKMHYSQSPQISIMVHRLRKTLLLEEFDVHKHLMRMQADEWKWLRSYFYEVIAKGEESKKFQSKYLADSPIKSDSHSEDMYMNLIRHSVAASEGEQECTVVAAAEDKSRIPIPRTEGDIKGFHHETLWKFEDMSMLIDSDLPIFGRGSIRRPCISLRLRDARSPPINVLTGLDYWLDNLMSNVPEVAMCYHISGVVQKYEVMKTEDIPNLENSSFDPNEVLDIAQNIMSFIKCNAAVEGHTYWLYKSENDEMVKLYDLTDYCKNEISEGDNPFTVPVGLLCHRVGRNLKKSGQRRIADSRAMFENCVRLLDENKHAQFVSDAHFHLCDMWVPDKSVNDIWQDKGKISEPPSDLYDEYETESDDGAGIEDEHNVGNTGQSQDAADMAVTKMKATSLRDEAEAVKNAVALKELVVRGMVKSRAWEVVKACRIAGTTDERCRQALSHIRKGLSCVDKDLARGKNIGLVEQQQTCNPSQAIPLHYLPLGKQVSGIAGVEELQTCSPFTSIPLPYSPLKSEDGKTLSSDTGDENISNESSSSSGEASKAGSSPQGESNSCKSSRSSENNSGSSWESADKSGSSWDSANKSWNSSEETEEKSAASWHILAKFHLLRKAAITYFVLAKEFFEINRYGHTLRHLRYAIHCYECLELLNESTREDQQDKELYLLMVYLAAQTRCCLSVNWQNGKHDFEELGEEEAAILHSAQAVLPNPKNAWIYEWSNSQEANLLIANDLYDFAQSLSALEKKPTSFKLAMKKNHGACMMSLGNVQLEICKEKLLKNDETWIYIKPAVEKTIETFKKTIKIFETANERNNAGHNCCNIAGALLIAAAAVKKESVEPLPSLEKDYIFKAIEWKMKALGMYERGEKMDDAREAVYKDIRMHYYNLSERYLQIPSGHISEEDLRASKEFLQKSLNYCFLDRPSKHLKNSQTCAANNHLNLGRVFDVEARNCNHSSRRKHLRHKMEEHFQKSCDLYHEVRWRRSEMSAKFLWVGSIADETETRNMNPPARKKLLRNVLGHLCDLRPALEALLEDDFDAEDDCTILPTNFSAVKQLLTMLNGSFCSFLKIDKVNNTVKQLYQRSLRLTPHLDLKELLPSLIDQLQSLQDVIFTEALH